MGVSADRRGTGSALELHEWSYASIEAECPRLGAQGWMAVLISSPATHATLTAEAAAALGRILRARA